AFMASERRSVWKIYRQICEYQSGLRTSRRRVWWFLAIGRWGDGGLLVVAEQAVDEKAKADDDEEPANAHAFALRADEPQHHHETEADGHDHDPAGAEPRSGVPVLDALYGVHAPLEAVRVDFRRRHHPALDHRDPLPDLQFSNLPPCDDRREGHKQPGDNGDDRNQKCRRNVVHAASEDYTDWTD